MVLERCRLMHNILLLKDPLAAHVDRFWNITLIKADLMFVMKDFWAGQLARNINASGALNEAQCSRRGQVVQMSVLNKRLS